MKKVLVSLCCMILCIMMIADPVIVSATEFTDSVVSAPQEEAESVQWPSGPGIYGGTAIVMDVDTGTILYGKNIHKQRYPASTTKILTAILALENSELSEEVTFSYNSVHRTEGSSIWRDVGEIMTMEQCLYALLLNSANECGYAIAEHVGGDYETFIQMMNDRAAALGCVDSHFSNPHGLTEEDHYTSVHDMALIACDAIKNETFAKMTATKTYQIPPTNVHDEITYLGHHHKMLRAYKNDSSHIYEYCIGGKTGYTQAAGNTLVTYAQKDGVTLCCVVMDESNPNHYLDTRELLDYCFDNFKVTTLAQEIENAATLPQQWADYMAPDQYENLNTDIVMALPKEATLADITIAAEEVENQVTLSLSYGEKELGSTTVQKVIPPEPEIPEEPEEPAQDTTLPLDDMVQDVNQEPEKFPWESLAAVVIVVIVFAAIAVCISLHKKSQLKKEMEDQDEDFEVKDV